MYDGSEFHATGPASESALSKFSSQPWRHIYMYCNEISDRYIGHNYASVDSLSCTV